MHLHLSFKTRYKCTWFKLGFTKVKKPFIIWLVCFAFFCFFCKSGYISAHSQIAFSGWMGGVKSSKSFCLWLLQFKPLTVGKPLSVSTIGISRIFGLFQGKQNTGRHPRDTGSLRRIVFLHFLAIQLFLFLIKEKKSVQHCSEGTRQAFVFRGMHTQHNGFGITSCCDHQSPL